MTIREYFKGEYAKARTEKEFVRVEKEEKRVFGLYEKGGYEFAEWAIEKGIELEAKSKTVKGYTELTLWVWDMEEEYE